jgi:hypothetical protein
MPHLTLLLGLRVNLLSCFLVIHTREVLPIL